MLNELINKDLVCSGDRIALGVSGGADSMLLLSAIIELKKSKDFYFKVLHVNHHLRGKESERDASFVADFCKAKGVDYEIIDVDVKALKFSKKKTLEESARIARFDAIYCVMKKENLSKLFLAHHRSDQAETVLMNICRGSGINGASGIKNTKEIFRPLLKISKSEILDYCKNYKIPYVTDSTNLENDCTRNYFRNQIIPMIKKVYPEAEEKIAMFGERLFEIQKYIEEMVDENLIKQEDRQYIVSELVFEKESFIVREYLKKVFEKLGIFADIETKHYALLMELNSKPVNSMLDMPHGVVAKKLHSGIKIYKKTTKNAINNEYYFSEGKTIIEGYGKILVEFVSPSEVTYGDGSFYIDYYKLSNDAVWRFRKLGDEFAKLGSGSKKLNDYFTDKKIDTDLRDKIPVLASGNHIYLVAEYDIGESVKIDSSTDKIAKIIFLEN